MTQLAETLVQENVTTLPGKSRSEFRRAINRFAKNRMAVAGAIFLIVIILACLFAPLVSEYVVKFSPSQMERGAERQGISAKHWLGTDHLGRDTLIRLLYAGQVSLTIGAFIVLISVSLGTLVGAITGYFGGWLDEIIMRFVDILRAIPTLYLILFVVSLFSANMTTTILILGLTGWMGVARLIRGEFLALRNRDFVIAARSVGVKESRVLIRHILPQTVSIIAITATLGMAQGIVAEAGLSFLGLGVQPPQPSWGNMIGEAQTYIWRAPLMLICPSAVLVLVIMSLNFVGDGLRDAFDPRLTN